MILNRNHLGSALAADSARPPGEGRNYARRAVTVLALGALAGALATPLPAVAPPAGRETPLVREAWLMGAPLRIAVEGVDREHGLRATEAAFAEVRRLEGILSTWDPDAEMARLNRAAPGRAVWAVIQ